MCWPDFDNDDAVRTKDAEEIYRFQLLIDELAGSLPIDVELNQLVLSTNWQTLNRETLTSSGKGTCLDHDSGVEVQGPRGLADARGGTGKEEIDIAQSSRVGYTLGTL